VLNEKFDLPNTFAASFNPLCVGNPGPVKLSGTRKVIQLTGDMDRETRHITPNQTGKNYHNKSFRNKRKWRKQE
jgi:hypothetical protein